jgi:hypothetical protein
MAEEAQKAPEVEAKITETETPAAVTQVTEKKEETLGAILGTKEKEPIVEKKEEIRMVPESTFLELKKDFKELKKEMKGKSKVEVSEGLDEFSEKYNLPPEFTSELAGLISKESQKGIDDLVGSKLKPLEDEKKAKKIDENFERVYAQAIEEMPEYKNLAKKEVIKAMATNPANSNKKFSEIFDEAYGHLVTGKKTLDSASNGARAFIGEIDYKRTATDKEYFTEVMANPITRKKYNDGLQERMKI